MYHILSRRVQIWTDVPRPELLVSTWYRELYQCYPDYSVNNSAGKVFLVGGSERVRVWVNHRHIGSMGTM